MGKELHVFLTNEEARKLDELCEVNGCTQSKIIKDAISILHGNGYASGEHDGELRVEIPLSMQLRGVVREAIKEARMEHAGNASFQKAVKEYVEATRK